MHPPKTHRPVPPFEGSKRFVPNWSVMHDIAIVTTGIPLEMLRHCIPTKDLVRYVEKDPCALSDTCSVAYAQLGAAQRATELQNLYWRDQKAVADETTKCMLQWLNRAPVNPMV